MQRTFILTLEHNRHGVESNSKYYCATLSARKNVKIGLFLLTYTLTVKVIYGCAESVNNITLVQYNQFHFFSGGGVG